MHIFARATTVVKATQMTALRDVQIGSPGMRVGRFRGRTQER